MIMKKKKGSKVEKKHFWEYHHRVGFPLALRMAFKKISSLLVNCSQSKHWRIWLNQCQEWWKPSSRLRETQPGGDIFSKMFFFPLFSCEVSGGTQWRGDQGSWSSCGRSKRAWGVQHAQVGREINRFQWPSSLHTCVNPISLALCRGYTTSRVCRLFSLSFVRGLNPRGNENLGFLPYTHILL
jgi:hypothetical protein